jgi:DNA-binding GntR family transcriptional regulator
MYAVYGIWHTTSASEDRLWNMVYNAERSLMSFRPPSQVPSEHRPETDRFHHDPLAINGSRRVFDEVYRRLRTAIIAGDFPAGERFVERSLTERLQVSRTPIREAIKRLEQEGLVVCYPHKGCFVRSPSYDEARQAYEMRRVAEGLAGELAASRATDTEIAAIQELLAQTRARLEAGDRHEMLLRNDEFHALQAQAARNAFLEQSLKTLWAYVDLLRGRWWAEADRAFATQAEHEAIAEALGKRDPGLARQRNEVHVDNAWRVVETGFKKRESASAPFGF